MFLCLRIKIILEVVECHVIAIKTPFSICSHGKQPEVFPCDIETGYGPVFKFMVRIAANSEQCELLPCDVDLGPRRLGSVSVKPCVGLRDEGNGTFRSQCIQPPQRDGS